MDGQDAEFELLIDDPSISHVDITHDPPIIPDSTVTDNYINMELGLPRGADDSLPYAKLKRRALDQDGLPMGAPSNNPMTDTRVYDVQFLNGSIEEIPVNVIAENLLSQVDEEGHRHIHLNEIIDHRRNEEAIPKEEEYFTTSTGTKRRKITTKGWEFCIQWKDGSTSWVSLKDLKLSHPVELADYARLNSIGEEAAMA